MATKKLPPLIFESEIDFDVIAISATEADYKLCLALGEQFDLSFSLADAIEKKINDVVIEFPVFSFSCDVRVSEICLINNKSSGNFLIREFRQADYFIRLKGDWALHQKDAMMQFLKQHNHVQALIEANLKAMKEIDWLSFELPDHEYLIRKDYETERRKHQ
jgi:hypothetical protein